MKTVRWLSVALVVVAFASLSVADDKKGFDKAKLIGKWEPTKKAGTIIELKKDGKMTITPPAADGKAVVMEGTYTFAEDKLKVKFVAPDGTERSHNLTVKTLTNDTLVTVDDKDKEEELKRVK